MTPDESPTCATCGDGIDPSEWHPAATGTRRNGQAHIVTFCGEDCRRAWLDDRAAIVCEDPAT